MTPAVQEMVAATYVRDIDVSRSFYELLGFAQDSTGRAATSGWSALQQGGYLILLASTTPPLDIPRLPLLFYFFFDEVDAVIARLRAGGVDVIRMGHPPHALGGEAKLLDPDGNTVLLGQRDRSASQQQPADDSEQHFSLLAEAAALVSAHGGAKTSCEVNDLGGKPCRQKADVKLADAAGDSVWACLDHADEILVTVRGAFIASQADEGIASYLAHRRK